MYNDTTAALLAIVAVVSAFGGGTKMMLRYPVEASIAALEIWFGLTLIYLGLNTHIIL